jgi:hypothetical protein
MEKIHKVHDFRCPKITFKQAEGLWLWTPSKKPNLLHSSTDGTKDSAPAFSYT